MASITLYDSRTSQEGQTRHYQNGSYFWLEDVAVRRIARDGGRRPTVFLNTAVPEKAAQRMSDYGVVMGGDGFLALPDQVRIVSMDLHDDDVRYGTVDANLFDYPQLGLDVTMNVRTESSSFSFALPQLHVLRRCNAGPDLPLAELLIDPHVLPHGNTLALSHNRKRRQIFHRGLNQAITMFRAQPVPDAEGGSRALDLGPELRDLVATLPNDCIAPTPPRRFDYGSAWGRMPAVFGFTHDLTQFRPYIGAPDNYSHLSGLFRMDCWTTPWNKVFIHRGRDGWRMLFCLEGRVEGEDVTTLPQAKPYAMHCIPLYLAHHELPKASIRLKGLPDDMATAVAHVPGMSVAMLNGLNLVRGMLRHIDRHHLDATQKLMRGHFLAHVGDAWRYDWFTDTSFQDVTPWPIACYGVQALVISVHQLFAKSITGANLLASNMALPGLQPVANTPVRFLPESRLDTPMPVVAQEHVPETVRALDL